MRGSISNKENLSAHEKGKQLYDLHATKEKLKDKTPTAGVDAPELNEAKEPNRDFSDINADDIEKLKLLKQQNLIIEHLKELEAEFSENKKFNSINKDEQNERKASQRYKNKLGQVDEYNTLNDLIKAELDDDVNFKKVSPKKPKDLYKTTPKTKINFHGIFF